jgi:hypothetical protein
MVVVSRRPSRRRRRRRCRRRAILVVVVIITRRIVARYLHLKVVILWAVARFKSMGPSATGFHSQADKHKRAHY